MGSIYIEEMFGDFDILKSFKYLEEKMKVLWSFMFRKSIM